MKKLFEETKVDITNAYESGITIPEAEKLATKLLALNLQVADELKIVSLDYRMRKAGVKAVKSAVYLAEVQKHDKKPSDVLLENLVNVNEMVREEQEKLDTAETEKEYLENCFGTFKEAHIHFRSIAKGKFD